MTYFEGSRTSAEEGTTDTVTVLKKSRIWLTWSPKMWLDWCNITKLNRWGITFTDEQRKWFAEVESTPGEDAVKIVEKTRKDLELTADKAVAGILRRRNILTEVLVWIKFYQTALHAAEKLFMKGRVNWCKLHCCLVWRNYHSHPKL